MIKPRLILCSGAVLPPGSQLQEGRHLIELNAHGPDANVHITFNDVAKVFQKHLSSRLTDLVEIAAYIYAADCGTFRGNQWRDQATTEPWGRDFHVVIPVRDLDFWKRDDVQTALVQTLQFMSDDTWAFTFVPWEEPEFVQGFLELGSDEDWRFRGADHVVMFSGGLDSLAGIVDSLARKERLVLVSHRPVAAHSARLRQLYCAIDQRFPGKTIHVPVWLNKQNQDRESTQRTRSFLYCALGVAVAASTEACGVRFFENGVVSLNLPVADEVLGARASRTTHPRSLAMLSRFHGLVMEKSFLVDNPYLPKTKSDIVSIIAQHSAGELIGQSRSCARGWFVSKTQWHCGICSQCIDRRIAILDADQQANERADDYVVDVFTGPRDDGPDKNIAVGYARHALELHKMSDTAIATRFNADFVSAVRGRPNTAAAVQELVEMHRRHAQSVVRVLGDQIQAHMQELLEGTLPESSLLSLVAGRRHVTSTWHRLANRIGELLSIGLPLACKTVKPKTEPHLQEIADGILQANGGDLQREFPFARWSASATKPDWSSAEAGLWVELKYVRTRTGIRQITEDIAADITKYGDTVQHVLFIVYDPYHLIDNDERFAAPIQSRPQFMVGFVR